MAHLPIPPHVNEKVFSLCTTASLRVYPRMERLRWSGGFPTPYHFLEATPAVHIQDFISSGAGVAGNTGKHGA